MRRLWLLILLLMLAAAVYAWLPQGRRSARKVFILGVDGLDPKLLQRFVEDGSLPHFKRLISQGDFKPLKTTMPPLSPVAWSTFVTGMDPGGHAIFDFLHRDPKTVKPEFSMSRAVPASWVLPRFLLTSTERDNAGVPLLTSRERIPGIRCRRGTTTARMRLPSSPPAVIALPICRA